MKYNLKEIINKLNPKIFGVNKINITSFKKLGVGEGNINYLFKIKNKKFICRLNIDKRHPKKSEEEFKSLKKVEKLDIAPNVLYLHKPDKEFPLGFIILEFIEGKAMRMKRRRYTTNQIKQLTRILSKIHNFNTKGFKRGWYKYKQFLEFDFIKKIRKNIANKYKDFFIKLEKIMYEQIPNENHKFTLIHGDVCPQNILETKKGLKLIDFEHFELSDPAKDIGNLLVDLRFDKKKMDLFLKEYFKFRKDKDILKRAKIYEKMFRYLYFIWEIFRAFEIKQKKLPKEYLQKTSAKEHLNEAKYQFRQLKKLVKVPDVNIEKLGTDII